LVKGPLVQWNGVDKDDNLPKQDNPKVNIQLPDRSVSYHRRDMTFAVSMKRGEDEKRMGSEVMGKEKTGSEKMGSEKMGNEKMGNEKEDGGNIPRQT
jgi:hypothetical protein